MNTELIRNGESKENISPFLFHHAIRKAKFCQYGIITPQPFTQESFLDKRGYEAYTWMQNQIGFNPLFIAVGSSFAALRISGYPATNKVLCSFPNIQSGIYTDYNAWEELLFSGNNEAKTRVFGTSQDQSYWHTRAIKEPGSVQLLLPQLDLTQTEGIFVPDEKEQKILEFNGFPRQKINILWDLYGLTEAIISTDKR